MGSMSVTKPPRWLFGLEKMLHSMLGFKLAAASRFHAKAGRELRDLGMRSPKPGMWHGRWAFEAEGV
jgi:hypothetical protein